MEGDRTPQNPAAEVPAGSRFRGMECGSSPPFGEGP
jgi:hypothetical protein